MPEDRPISAEEWATVVRSVPIVSVDLVVRHAGGVVLGRRTNEPAKGEWFVPGGRVHRGERLREAVDRVAEAELGVPVRVVERLGVYEHLYDVADVEDVDAKHYVPVAYVVDTRGSEFDPDEQHGELRVFEPPFEVDFHPYVAEYLRDAGLLKD